MEVVVDDDWVCGHYYGVNNNPEVDEVIDTREVYVDGPHGQVWDRA